MGGSARERRLKDGLVLACKSLGDMEFGPMINEPNALRQCPQAIQARWKLPLEVPACLLGGKATGADFPEPPTAKLDEQRGLAVRIVRGCKRDVGIEEHPHVGLASRSRMRARSFPVSVSSASHRATCSSL